MPSITVGVNNVFPAGKYLFVVKNCKETTSRGKGYPMLEMLLHFDDGEDGADVIDRLVFTEAAFFRIEEFLKSVGAVLVPGQVVDVEADDTIDKTGVAEIDIEEWEGRQRNKVVKYLPAPAPAPIVTVNELGEPNNIPF